MADRTTRSFAWPLGLILLVPGIGLLARATEQAAVTVPARYALGYLFAPFRFADISLARSLAPGSQAPVQLTREEDHQRILNLLNISSLPRGASSLSPDTYDESKANPFPKLPDPLTLKNGQRVTTAAMWQDKRRAEILEEFEREIYGRTKEGHGNHRFPSD